MNRARSKEIPNQIRDEGDKSEKKRERKKRRLSLPILITQKETDRNDVQTCTELGYEVGPRLRELVPRGQRKSGGGIHAT